ncbi:MAG: hypothetical protein L0211_13905 [Planctomycetaceae bacterium]|nr:hypothetical protein [Planctomycetaceae bacterium]
MRSDRASTKLRADADDPHDDFAETTALVLALDAAQLGRRRGGRRRWCVVTPGGAITEHSPLIHDQLPLAVQAEDGE